MPNNVRKIVSGISEDILLISPPFFAFMSFVTQSETPQRHRRRKNLKQHSLDQTLFALGHFQGLFGGHAAGLAVAADDNVLAKQCLSLQFFPHGLSKASAGFYRHFTWLLSSHLIASRFFLR